MLKKLFTWCQREDLQFKTWTVLEMKDHMEWRVGEEPFIKSAWTVRLTLRDIFEWDSILTLTFQLPIRL
jgi:hypothetical protein